VRKETPVLNGQEDNAKERLTSDGVPEEIHGEGWSKIQGKGGQSAATKDLGSG